MKIKDLLCEDDFEDDGDDGFAAPEYTPDEDEGPAPPPLTGAENPDVWHREDNENIGRIVDQRLGSLRGAIQPKLRGAMIAWVKETGDPSWNTALATIVKALRASPSLATRLQGCRNLTQAARIAQETVAAWSQF